MKRFLISIFICIPLLLCGQDRDRIDVYGIVTAPAGEDLEEISIYNISTEKGTVTNAQGEFTLSVGEHDRVQITALQYKSFTIIVTSEDIQKKKIAVYLNPYVNHLEEVTVRSTDLSGIVDLDAKKIKTSVFSPEWDLSYATLEFGYRFEREGVTEIDGNAAEEALGMHNIPMASVDIGQLVALFFPRKTPSGVIVSNKVYGVDALFQKFELDYISKTFEIPSEKVIDFIYFAEENGLTTSMLRPENEMKLLKYLFQQSVAYRKQIASED